MWSWYCKLRSVTSVTRLNKKLSYCWETVRRESMPVIAEMDVEIIWQPKLKWPSNYFKVIKSGNNRKLVYDFLLVVYSNFCRITHRFWEIWCETVQWPWNMCKVIDSRITWKLSCGHVCKMFGRQWTNEAKIAIFNGPTLIWRPLSSEPPRISAQTSYCQKLCSLGYIFVADSIWVALQIFEQFCPKTGDANPLVAESETAFNAKWPFKVIQDHLFRYLWRATNGLHSTI